MPKTQRYGSRLRAGLCVIFQSIDGVDGEVILQKSVILQPVTIGEILSFLLKLLRCNEKSYIFIVLSEG